MNGVTEGKGESFYKEGKMPERIKVKKEEISKFLLDLASR